MFKTRKVVIVGAGHVGSHVALALIQSGEADDIVLIDILKEKAIGQALDLDDCVSGSLCGKDVSIRAGSYEELHDADIMVMAFGRSRRPGETRLDMFDDSIKMANEVVSHLKQVDFRGIMISISNPADIICEYIRRQMDWQPSRCFCTGTSLETYRLLRVISKATGYSRRSIHGFCMGEHGNSSFIVWSRIFIGGKPFLQLRRERPVLAEISLEDLQTQVKKAGDIERLHRIWYRQCGQNAYQRDLPRSEACLALLDPAARRIWSARCGCRRPLRYRQKRCGRNFGTRTH